jgi:hypothetical protein
MTSNPNFFRPNCVRPPPEATMIEFASSLTFTESVSSKVDGNPTSEAPQIS